MAKKVVSAAEISGLIARELEKHPQCANVWTPQVFWHVEDGGSNWDVDIHANTNSDADACEDCIREAVQALRAKYKVFGPG